MLRVVYLIHGDADYTYHDAAGNRLHADREALRQAGEAGARAMHAEMFVFHQRTGWSHRLRGVPGGTFHHYRHGNLVQRNTYSRSEGGFEPESRILRRHVTRTQDAAEVPLVLAYFGHEIPSVPDRPDRRDGLTVTRFAQGLEGLSSARARPPAGNGSWSEGNHKPYGLVILSTCYGGNPAMMEALAPLADYAVASPAYLHLSYLDARALSDFRPLDSTPVRALADTVARQSFERLKAATQTEITVAVYDLKEAAPFLASRAARTQGNATGSAWRDCADDPAFDAEEAARGVTLYSRAPRFGPGKDAAARSGWQCAD